MNSSISSYLPRCKKPSFWQSSTTSSATSTDRIRLSKIVRPWKSYSNGKRPDHPSALIRTGAAMGVTSTAHRNARRSGSHLLAAAGSSFGHVQRNLLNVERSRHGPVPCAWQPDSAEPLQSGQPVWRDPSTRLSSDNLVIDVWSRWFCTLTTATPCRRLLAKMGGTTTRSSSFHPISGIATRH